MRRVDRREPQTIRQTLAQLGVDDLKPLLALIGVKKTGRKEELIDTLANALEDPDRLRAIYDSLDDLGKKAVQEATHDPQGVLHVQRFRAKHCGAADMGGSGRFRTDRQPTHLRLFFPLRESLPTDLQARLLAFVPAPPPLQVEAGDGLPARLRRPHKDLGSSYWKPDEQEVDLRVRETAQDAFHDIQAVLRLVDAGKVHVSAVTHRPSQATVAAVAGVLAGGDFYGAEDASDFEYDAAAEVTIKAFAWPMLLQAAGLVQCAGAKLQRSPAGKKALAVPGAELVRQVWTKWLDTSLLDEFSRIDVIKGQQSKGKGGMTAVPPRRHALLKVLAECPLGKWIGIEEFFRLVKILAKDMQVSHDSWKLYLGEQRYGSFGYDARYPWDALVGRYVLAFLFEYAATLGLLDVAYIGPVNARNDFHDRWGADELSCLSRYDGLMFVRINALGAWCLGRADKYQPPARPAEALFRVLPNLDVVVGKPPLNPADALFLDRFAERQSDAVWHLGAAKVLAVVEEGARVAELREYLQAGTQESLPQTVEVFLNDLEARVGQVEDLGTARLIACANAHTAELLANDRRLRALCERSGERHLVFRIKDETAVRRGLRELGYALPPPR